jgi:hypothetical protein
LCKMAVRGILSKTQCMKPCIIFALLLAVTTVAVAQQPLSDGVKKKLDAALLGSFSRPDPKVRVVGKGKVYTLSPDNMPCLAPDMKAVAAMPNAGGVILDDRMNALPRQRIIPREGGWNKK